MKQTLDNHKFSFEKINMDTIDNINHLKSLLYDEIMDFLKNKK